MTLKRNVNKFKKKTDAERETRVSAQRNYEIRTKFSYV